MNRIVFKGTCTAAVTPFTKDGIDYEAFKKQIDFQVNGGVDAIAVLGTTGEAAALTDDEYEGVARFAKEHINGRVKFILGCGSNCTIKAIKRSVFAEKLGADGILAVTPYYNKCTQKGLVKYYGEICKSVSLPIIAYNVPARTGVNALPETLAEIAEYPNMCGVKEASGDIRQIAEAARLLRGKIAFYAGDDALNLPALKLGSSGVISVVSNIFPKETCDIARLYFEGKYALSEAAQQKLTPMIRAAFIEVNPIPIKAAMEYAGLGSARVRSPLTPLEFRHRAALLNAMYGLGARVSV